MTFFQSNAACRNIELLETPIIKKLDQYAIPLALTEGALLANAVALIILGIAMLCIAATGESFYGASGHALVQPAGILIAVGSGCLSIVCAIETFASLRYRYELSISYPDQFKQKFCGFSLIPDSFY